MDKRAPYAPADHWRAKTGMLANLGTPDNYDYWSMRRYLNEFLSDKRVIDYSPFLWQPLLQLVILTKRPFTSGANYKSIWNHDKGESPLMTITKDQTARIAERMTERFGGEVVVDFCMRYGNPSTESKVRALVEAGASASSSSRSIRIMPAPPRPRPAISSSAR
jgi:protoporphyrin/coproporphyrin ferrochelatase